jgi:hypothetical protein
VLDVVLAAVATALPLRGWRFYPEFAIFALPVLARSAAMVWRKAATRATWPSLSIATVAICTLWMASTAAYGLSYAKNGHRQLGFGHGGENPIAEAAYIKQQSYRGALLNDYTDGAYVIYALHPDVRPVIDSRIDVYGAALWAEYNDALSSPDALSAYLKKYDVALVLTHDVGIRSFLESSGKWVLENASGPRMLLVRTDLAASRR